MKKFVSVIMAVVALVLCFTLSACGNKYVYYDFDDEKLNLFEIETNGSVDGETETFTGNKTIYIIIESDGKCNDGSFSFVLEKSEK